VKRAMLVVVSYVHALHTAWCYLLACYFSNAMQLKSSDGASTKRPMQQRKYHILAGRPARTVSNAPDALVVVFYVHACVT